MKGWKLEGWKVQEVLSYPLFPDTSTEPSAAGARRGVSNCIQTNCIQMNCIQTTILLGPPAEGRPGPSIINFHKNTDKLSHFHCAL